MVLVEDECRLQEESSLSAIWYPRGQYPTIKVHQRKKAISFYGALNVKTGECIALDTPRQTSIWTVKFLRKLEGAYRDKKVLLIWDGAPWHRGEVKRYLREGDKLWKLKLMYFPPYWPKLNPQEKVWKEAKGKISHNSTDDFDAKTLNFYKYLISNTFNTNFLKKYT